MEEPAGRWLVQRGNTVPWLVIGNAVEVFGFIEIDKVTDKQIQPAVIVVIEPHRARGPTRSGDPRSFGNVTQGSVTIVVIENAFSVLRHIQIRKTVAVVVTDSNPLSVAPGRYARLLGDVGKGTIAIVAIERVAQGRIGIVEVTFAAVD